MSEKKWTEGPWEVHAYHELHDVRGDYYEVISTLTELIVAKCGTGRYQIKANANLIAAAPELYEALEQALLLVDISTSYRSVDIAQQARAALAKARGEHE